MFRRQSLLRSSLMLAASPLTLGLTAVVAAPAWAQTSTGNSPAVDTGSADSAAAPTQVSEGDGGDIGRGHQKQEACHADSAVRRKEVHRWRAAVCAEYQTPTLPNTPQQSSSNPASNP